MTDDVKALWRRQPLDATDMNLAALRARADAQLASIRRARLLLVGCVGVGVAMAIKLAVSAPTTLLRLGEGLLAVGFVFVLILGWRRLSLSSPETGEACLSFLRQMLERRRRAVQGGWIALVAPLLPGMAVMLVGLAVASGGAWLRLAPIAALLALWLIIMLVIQAREAAKVSAELAWLDQVGAPKTAPMPPGAAP
ncbi:hypothetical protein [Caulobacter sp. X]|uniref:hypothetical protein n=1 Tax=Caulobacter sp. X TaxID=2048901 RepID=UPI000C14AE35|nr:hypothetical protein [Caulobacter sp. X]PIC00761.1 hypothetical protein CSW60_04160 [Caulobacter sp. X]